jgi:hypothetical protein
MPQKTPQKDGPKKPGRTIKEKRAAKKMKQAGKGNSTS